MDIEIRKLTPDHAEAYARFFDTTPHDNSDEEKCYCVCWCSGDDAGIDFSSPEKRRALAIRYVRGGSIQGYLAYHNGQIVGWCNANARADCLQCASWRRFMAYVPLEESGDVKVKSIFCFVIAPEMQRKGIATQLLERACQDAAREGFDFVEAYPFKESGWQSSEFGGYLEMYRKSGFFVHAKARQGLVMRRALQQ